jgi:hypothetical protein
VARSRAEGIRPEVFGLNAESHAIVGCLAIYDKSPMDGDRPVRWLPMSRKQVCPRDF